MIDGSCCKECEHVSGGGLCESKLFFNFVMSCGNVASFFAVILLIDSS